MARWGAVVPVCLLLAGSALSSGPGEDQCAGQCRQVYSLHTSQYEQVRPSLEACLAGCRFFTRIEARSGLQDTLGNLQNCNYSCDERFEGGLLPACQSGCGFHFDSDVSARRTSQGPPPPAPTFSRGPPPAGPTFTARGPAFARPQGPPRPTVFLPEEPRSQSTPWAEDPRAQTGPPAPRLPMELINMLRNNPPPPGPVMLRPGSFNVTPGRVEPVPQGAAPRGNMVTKQNPRGPTIIGFSLPQLLSRVQGLLPRMEQAGPRPLGLPSMQQIFARMEQEQEQELPSIEFGLPDIEQVFERMEEALPEMDQRLEPLSNRVMEIEIENPFEEYEDFEEAPRMSLMPRFPNGFFGRRDGDNFDFGGLFNQLTERAMSSQFSQSWSPFGQQNGKLTIIKAGPGFHDEQHFDIGPDGKLVEITETPITRDALEHENPMDVHFNSNDVEVFHAADDTNADAEVIEVTEAAEEPEAVAPVMDVWAVEAPEAGIKELQAEQLPFLSVLQNTVAENDRMTEQLLQRLRSVAEREYRDDFSCSSDRLKWSDWVACLHARVGVPRWLTAATISLGIVFAVWLCLVIPSAAPRQRVRALVIRTAEKPSAALAKAKEAEAASKACEAAGVDPATVVSVVRVDLPPSYGEVRPASPAPSYKSEMAAPASPAPSYRTATKEEQTGDKVVVEPVHGEKEKESVA